MITISNRLNKKFFNNKSDAVIFAQEVQNSGHKVRINKGRNVTGTNGDDSPEVEFFFAVVFGPAVRVPQNFVMQNFPQFCAESIESDREVALNCATCEEEIRQINLYYDREWDRLKYLLAEEAEIFEDEIFQEV